MPPGPLAQHGASCGLQPQHAATVRMALLTPFSTCRRRPWPHGEVPADHNSQRLLERWHTHAQGRRWGPLFQSMMEAFRPDIRHCTDPGGSAPKPIFSSSSIIWKRRPIPKSGCGRPGGPAGQPSPFRSRRGTDDDIHQIEDRGGQGPDPDHACQQGAWNSPSFLSPVG
jgi:hypothetical protein